MTRSKISYLDETLKRLPIIGLLATVGWWGLTKLNSIESKIEQMELLTYKDKEIISNQIVELKISVSEANNRNNEQDKQLFRCAGILPTKKRKEE